MSKRSIQEHQKSTLICRIRTREGDPADDGYLLLISLAVPDQSSCQLSSDEQMKQSCLVLKECLTGRARTSANPDQTYNIPYKHAKLTKLFGEVLNIESSRQSRVVLHGNISYSVVKFDTSTNTLGKKGFGGEKEEKLYLSLIYMRESKMKKSLKLPFIPLIQKICNPVVCCTVNN